MRSALLVCIACYSVAGGAPPVEGDGALLELLRSAQETNATLYPRGRLSVEATFVSRTFEGEERRTQVTGYLVWDGENTYRDFVRLDQNPTYTQRKLVSSIDSDNKRIVHVPDRSALETYEGPSAKVPRIYRLRPDELWFRLERETEWKLVLSPTHLAEFVEKYLVRRLDEDRVLVERHHADDSVFRIEASLRTGGNIVRYELSQPNEVRKGMWADGRFHWAKHSSGVWYLKQYDYMRSFSNNPQEPDHVYSMVVTDFDPNPSIPRSRFEMASLDLAAGTMVTEYGPDNREKNAYRIGDAAPPAEGVEEEVFENLARKLRDKGFASPRRQ